jgi:hypothetical protein
MKNHMREYYPWLRIPQEASLAEAWHNWKDATVQAEVTRYARLYLARTMGSFRS